MTNLLHDPLFRAETPQGQAQFNLPALLAALGESGIDALSGLQRHQEDAFHIFLCYLAGAVLARAAVANPRQDEAFWRAGLLKLADGNENAWQLVVEDPTQPAFLQAPLPEKHQFAAFKSKKSAPDELDVLQIGRWHDVKPKRSRTACAETWIYSLISLQTMAGYGGRVPPRGFYYGISRMNGGTGSRVRVEAIYDLNLGKQWESCVRKLLLRRPDLLDGPWGYKDHGTVLTWVIPWDLKRSLNLASLDPFFIESSRAIRVLTAGEYFYAVAAGSEVKRINSGESANGKGCQGNLGDPWTPIVNDGKEIKAWTVTEHLSTKDLRDLVFSDGQLQAAVMQRQEANKTGASYFLKLSVLVPKGNCKTNGFCEVIVPIPNKAAISILPSNPEQKRISKRSVNAIGYAGTMQHNVLKLALYAFLEGGPNQINLKNKQVSDWIKQTLVSYSERWAADFFPLLWDSLDSDDETARLAWLEHLRGVAWAVLQDAMTRLPLRGGRSHKSRVRAESLFLGSLYKTFPDLKKENHHADSDRLSH